MAEHRKSLDDCAREYAEMSQDKLPSSLGFSARLNMLWDLAGVAPSQFEGRVLVFTNTGPAPEQPRPSSIKGPPPTSLAQVVELPAPQLDVTEPLLAT